MTELEKKAKVYRKSRKDLQYFSEPYKKKIEKAYVDGAKENGVVWHDLRKNPTDVPKEKVTVLLLTEVEPVTARYSNKYEAFFRLGDKLDYCVFIAPMSYISWCEIPEFGEADHA